VKSRLKLLFALSVLLAACVAAAWYFLSRSDLPVVDLEGAEPSVQHAVEQAMDEVKRQPSSDEAWGRLGLLLLAHGWLDDAAVCLARAEKLGPNEPRWPYALSQTAPGDLAFVIACLERAEARAGDNVSPRLSLSEALLEQGRIDDAEAGFRKALKQEQGNARARLGMARTALARGALDESRKTLVELIDEASCQKAAHSLLAEVYHRQDQREKAEKEREAAALLPADLPWPDPFRDELESLAFAKHALLMRLKNLIQQKQFDRVRELSRQIELEHPEVHWMVEARERRDRGDLTGAVDAYRKSIELDSTWQESRFELAQVLMKLENFPEAATELRPLVRDSPTHGAALLALGECEHRMGDRQEALKQLRLATAVMPSSGAAHRELGDVLLEEGDAGGAVQHLENAVQLDPKDAKAKQLLELARQKKSG